MTSSVHKIKPGLEVSGQPGEAQQQLIADQTRILGSDHDSTMLSRHELAEADVMSSLPREDTIARLYSLRDHEHHLYGTNHWRTRWTDHFLERLDR